VIATSKTKKAKHPTAAPISFILFFVVYQFNIVAEFWFVKT